jgi:hypothetical protein
VVIDIKSSPLHFVFAQFNERGLEMVVEILAKGDFTIRLLAYDLVLAND